MATEEAVEVGADLVALIGLQVVALLAASLEEVGALLGVTCDACQFCNAQTSSSGASGSSRSQSFKAAI